MWIIWPILLPLSATTLAFLLKKRGATAVSLAASLGILLSVAGLVLQVWERGVQRHVIGGWEAPLGIALYADGLSVVMLAMAAVVGTLTSVYAAGYWLQDRKNGDASSGYFFWPLWMFLWTALNVIFLSADMFNLYVGLEVLSLAAVALVTLEGKRAALVGGMRYLLASFMGSLAYLTGVALLYVAFGTLDMTLLGERIAPGPASGAAIALITVGMLLKTALFPLHFWLPPAHASAPAPVSALLSGLVIKASFYLLLRLWFEVFPAALTPAVAHILGILGAVGILWGSFLALRQRHLKVLVAFSTVAQVGYLFLVFPLANQSAGSDVLHTSVVAWSGGVYHAIAHACAKAAVFTAAGTLAYVIGNDLLDNLPGIFHRCPISVAAFTLGGVSLIGLPPSGGFIAKWLLITAALESGQWWVALVILAGSLLAAGYVFLVLGAVIVTGQSERVAPSALYGLERSLGLPALVLALTALVLGAIATPLLELLRIGAPFAAY